MSRPALQVEGISKRYRLGTERTGQYRTLRESVERATTTALRRVSRRGGPDRSAATGGDFWALRDVSFNVEPGEVVGILGRNGAGKSTLLKVLSRIVEPTAGRATIRGRVGSLLEVGTGFHPELTGRENIYLNGSILGMSRRDIARQFDAIVDFAEVEAFLDTPVKRYSSGMYVRLAFAVAAHLDLDILIVDEVLAVGDIQFQKKCLGKMQDITSMGGRAVLFVSHNMGAVQSLCTRAVLLDRGSLVFDGSVQEGVGCYTSRQMTLGADDLSQRLDRTGTGGARITRIDLIDGVGNTASGIGMGEPFALQVHVDVSKTVKSPSVFIAVWTISGQRIFRLFSRDQAIIFSEQSRGFRVTCQVDHLPLNYGMYEISAGVLDGANEVLDDIRNATQFEVIPRDVLGTGHLPKGNGDLIFIRSRWRINSEAAD